MDKKMQKKQCRSEINKKIAALSAEYNQQASRRIGEWLCGMEAFRKAETIFCFVGTPKEIDTSAIIRKAWKCGKSVVVPRCLEKGQMEACIIKKEDDLTEGKFGIREPKVDCPVLKPAQIDLIVVPCLSCDKKGNRLGHGGGYYDRYLEKCDAVRVVVCREKLMLEEIPTEPFDQKSHYLVTEKGILPIS